MLQSSPSNSDDRRAGDAFEDVAVDDGRHHGAVPHDAEDVHAPEFLESIVPERVQEEHLLATVGLGFLLGIRDAA